jgi:hypothetical protein
MKLMGGWIDITIDGDLFKVKLMLKSAEQEKKPLIINEL